MKQFIGLSAAVLALATQNSMAGTCDPSQISRNSLSALIDAMTDPDMPQTAGGLPSEVSFVAAAGLPDRNYGHLVEPNGSLSYRSLILRRRQLRDEFRAAREKPANQRTASDQAVIRFFQRSYTVMQAQVAGECMYQSSAQIRRARSEREDDAGGSTSTPVSRETTAIRAQRTGSAQHSESCSAMRTLMLTPQQLQEIRAIIVSYQNYQDRSIAPIRREIDSSWTQRMSANDSEHSDISQYIARLHNEARSLDIRLSEVEFQLCSTVGFRGTDCQNRLMELYASRHTIQNDRYIDRNIFDRLQEYFYLLNQLDYLNSRINIAIAWRLHGRLSHARTPGQQLEYLSDPSLNRLTGPRGASLNRITAQTRDVLSRSLNECTAATQRPSDRPSTPADATGAD